MSMNLKCWVVVLLFAPVGHSFAATPQSEGSLLASIRKAGEIKVAMGSAPPYSFVSPTGEAEGYAIDVVKLALEGMGLSSIKVRGVLIAWDAMIPALQAHQVDLVVPGLTITESRCKAVLYSVPTSAYQDALYLLPGNPKHLTGYSAVVRSPRIKLAVITGASQGAYAVKVGVKPEQLVLVTDIQAGAATVTGGRADAFAVSQSAIPAPEQKGLEVVIDQQSPINGYGVTFRKEDVRFRDAFNKQLNLLIGSGAIEKLYDKYKIPNGGVVAGLVAKFTKAGDMVPGCE
ncbi:hypothetical protein AS156_19165 [Bradyrhizobium macuxiense]|uniref:Solute-binding protein family 3/N-terminal domain-containing protein n=1 Tax=Bradyrhizobium macuxiense TaxID=1755647 RepID=A0A109JFJ3_9BRAD|nr:transporter substrate-binding domain-containing protein [Bradyrhizobium macuxiense]KWV48087.1 hypothetical protein AS156_19165 [Bradyrhizobium macuxiense]